MRIYQTIAILFICLSLFAGGIANAAMACCIQPPAAEKMQMDKSNADMPCHKDAAKKESKTHKSCEKCWNCVGTIAVINPDTQHSLSFAAINHSESYTGFNSHNPDRIYSPPKSIS